MSQTEVALIKALSVLTGDIADQAVTLDKLPHGTSSNDGKFLRANNGADPTFETIAAPDLSNLNATNLTSGTIPDARFPATLPAISGANLTNLPGGGKIERIFVQTGGSQQASGSFTTYLEQTVTNVTADARYLIFISFGHRIGQTNSQWYSTSQLNYTNASSAIGTNFYNITYSTSFQYKTGFVFDQNSNTTNRTYQIQHRSSTTQSSGRSYMTGGLMVTMEFKV